jgi:uncharacterized protein YqjF (DUF2071 family)
MELNGGPELRIKITSTIESVHLQPDLAARRALQQEPQGTPVMYQTWSDLLFLHWEWDPAELQATLPLGLYIDTFGGKAYVGLIPFRMTDVRASILPQIPGASQFLELNVRTYVHDRNGRPGVWFYSLDLNHGLGVALAKTFYSLPYHSATMTSENRAGLIEFRCQRQTVHEGTTLFYRNEAGTVGSSAGSLAYFLAERYLLYSFSARTQKLYTARVYHTPWELFQAQVGKYDTTQLRLNHLNPRLRPPKHSWYGSAVRVKIYALEEA